MDKASKHTQAGFDKKCWKKYRENVRCPGSNWKLLLRRWANWLACEARTVSRLKNPVLLSSVLPITPLAHFLCGRQWSEIDLSTTARTSFSGPHHCRHLAALVHREQLPRESQCCILSGTHIASTEATIPSPWERSWQMV